MADFLRLHLIPRQAIDLSGATIDDCVKHAMKAAKGISESLAHLEGRPIGIFARPSEGGMRYLLGGEDIEIAYGCVLGNYFDNHLTSANIRMRNTGLSPEMKSYLLIRNPQVKKARSILVTTSVLQHDYLLHHEQGFPIGWQAFVRRYGPGHEVMGKKWKQHISTLHNGNIAMETIGLQPSEWVAKTDDGYVLRAKSPMYLN